MKVVLVSNNDALAGLAQLLNGLETTSTNSVDDAIRLALGGDIGYIVIDAKSVPAARRIEIRRGLRQNRAEVGFRAIDPTNERLVRQTAEDLIGLATSPV
jgi:hypothetical protein